MNKTPRKWLRFNYQTAATSFLEEVEDIAWNAVEQFYMDATRGRFVDVKVERDSAALYIAYKVIFGASSIMQSFGTGSAMDKTSRYLADYMQSNLFNRLRQGFAVVGREEGEYTNIFGETVYSEGAFAGTSIEGTFYTPQQPTYDIQNAEKWLEQKGGWLDQLIKRRIEQWFNKNWDKFWEYN